MTITQALEQWLAQNRAAIDAKVRRGIDQLDRGGGIPEEQLEACLAKLKAQAE
jgi:predicted transcriptional regulator